MARKRRREEELRWWNSRGGVVSASMIGIAMIGMIPLSLTLCVDDRDDRDDRLSASSLRSSLCDRLTSAFDSRRRLGLREEDRPVE
ncbi:hypothetical protein ACSBR1_027268 [Camellia fascicularis]